MSLAAGIRVSVLMLLLLLPASSIKQQLGILPVRVAASGASKALFRISLCMGVWVSWVVGLGPAAAMSHSSARMRGEGRIM